VAGLLERTISAWSREPCDPFPCGTEVWRYACSVAGVPVPALPEHRTRRAVTALLREHGGLIPYAASLVEPLGWTRLEVPGAGVIQRGDVGVVLIPGMGATCAIYLGRRWMAKGDRAILITEAAPLAAWSAPQCRKLSPPQSSPPSD
jgi:hypothetical protein